VNFVTCHDGFTLNDLVSYDRKHNEANGEDNRDGTDDNRSWNCGVEGPTDDPGIDKLRTRQVKNFFTATMLAPGMPMMLMGDEVRRTQHGNNNAYCLDDETTWFDWTLVAKRAELLRFVSMLNAFRALRDPEYEREGWSLSQLLERSDIGWHGIRLNDPDWRSSSHSIAFMTRPPKQGALFHVMINAYWEPLSFELPPVDHAGHPWRRWIDTFLDSPDDIADRDHAPEVAGSSYRVQPRSVVILFMGSEA